jgi:hypothetical protein
MECTCQQEFEVLLERIRRREHPDYGVLAWDRQRRQISVTVQFERSVDENDQVVRTRALRYLEALTPEEQTAVDIEVSFRGGRPVKATLRTGTGELSADRLRELARRAGLN